MGTLKNEYKSFLDDIEKNIKNKEDLEYVKKRFASFLDVMLEQMDYIVEYKKEEIEKIESNQKEINEKMSKMQNIIDNIEKDIYSDEGFDFEITCPECHNLIELDWTGDIDDNEEQNGCQGSCNGCHGCDEKDEDDDM